MIPHCLHIILNEVVGHDDPQQGDGAEGKRNQYIKADLNIFFLHFIV